jgi:hypothetical protein
MTAERLRLTAATGFVIGAVFGMAGTFAPSPALRGIAWGVDGTAIVVACALVAVYHARRGDELLAAGFLVFLAGETLIVSASALPLATASAIFGAGTCLWSAGVGLVSASAEVPRLVRLTGSVAAALLAATAIRILGGTALTPLSAPLPYAAYPFLAATLVGWAWVHARPSPVRQAARAE